MGEIALTSTAIANTHDLNKMFDVNKTKTWKRINNIRDERIGTTKPLAKFLAPSDPTKKPPRVQSLRFAASELTRQVRWQQVRDPSRGDRRALLRWLAWVEMDTTRRGEAQKMVAALDYFARATVEAKVPTVTFTWAEKLPDDPQAPVGKFEITVTPAIDSTTPVDTVLNITIAVSSTDVYHGDLEDDED